MDNVLVIRREVSKMYNRMELGFLEVSEDSCERINRLSLEHDKLLDAEEELTQDEEAKFWDYTDKIRVLREFLQSKDNKTKVKVQRDTPANPSGSALQLVKVPQMKLRFSGFRDWRTFRSLYDAIAKSGIFTWLVAYSMKSLSEQM